MIVGAVTDPRQEARVVAGVPGPPPFGLTGSLEVFLAVLANGLQQPVAGLRASFLGHYQRSRYQARQQLEHRIRVDALPAADRLGRFQGGAAGEDRQPGQQGLFGP